MVLNYYCVSIGLSSFKYKSVGHTFFAHIPRPLSIVDFNLKVFAIENVDVFINI